MRFIAEELREYMAKLGVRSVDELVGRTDLLAQKENLTPAQKKIDISGILGNPYAGNRAPFSDPKKVYDLPWKRHWMKKSF